MGTAADLYIQKSFRDRELASLIEKAQSTGLPMSPEDFLAIQEDRARVQGIQLPIEELKSRLINNYPQLADRFSNANVSPVLDQPVTPSVPLRESVSFPSLGPPTRQPFSTEPGLASEPFPTTLVDFEKSLASAQQTIPTRKAQKGVAPLGKLQDATGGALHLDEPAFRPFLKEAGFSSITGFNQAKPVNIDAEVDAISLRDFNVPFLSATQEQRRATMDSFYSAKGVGTGLPDRTSIDTTGKHIWNLVNTEERQLVNRQIEKAQERITFNTAIATGQASVETELNKRLTPQEAILWYLPKEGRLANSNDTPRSLRIGGAIPISDKLVDESTQSIAAHFMVSGVKTVIDQLYPAGMGPIETVGNAIKIAYKTAIARDEAIGNLVSLQSELSLLARRLAEKGVISDRDVARYSGAIIPSLNDTKESALQKVNNLDKLLTILDINTERRKKGLGVLSYDEIISGAATKDMNINELKARTDALKNKRKENK